jgi:SH3-like domain-containing protein
VLFKKSSFFSKPVAKIKKGRLLIVKTCEDNWCKVKTDNLKGWVNKDNLWGSIN